MGIRLFICMIVSLAAACHSHAEGQKKEHNFNEYCIIGAGPGGLQLAYYMHQAGRDYRVYEKGNQAGSFFQKYLRDKRLRGLNKRYTGSTNKQSNLRYDLNSLISHNDTLRMTKYSNDLFPLADDFVRYLNDFAAALELNVQYNTTMGNVGKYFVEKTHGFRMNDQHNKTYLCHYVIIATGVGKPVRYKHEGSEYVDSCEGIKLDLNDYKGRFVLVVGQGNLAFEIANHILPATASVHVATSIGYDFAWKTQYQGDLEAKEAGIFDTYLLKSLDGVVVVRTDLKKVSVSRRELDGKLLVSLKKLRTNESREKSELKNLEMREGYDKIIRCDGFQWDSSFFADNMTIRSVATKRNENLPVINLAYESLDVRKLYFAGALTHSLDYRTSAGGFINGFRYNAKSLHNILEWKHYGIKWPAVYFHSLSDLLSHITKRISEGSDIFHMHGVLCDFAIYNVRKTEASYLQAVPCLLASKLKFLTGHSVLGAFLAVSMEYGKNYHSNKHAEKDNHQDSHFRPVLYYYEKGLSDKEVIKKPKTWCLPVPERLHVVEKNLPATYKRLYVRILSLRRFIEQTSKTDLRFFFAHQCLMLSLTVNTLPVGCQQYSVQKNRLVASNSIFLNYTKAMSYHLLPFRVSNRK